MPVSRVAALTRRIVLQLRRDHRTLGLIVVVPILVLTLLAYLFRLEATDIPLAVVTEERSPAEATEGSISIVGRLIRELEETEDFEVTEISAEEVDHYLRSGKVKGALIFPEGYTRRALLGRRMSVEVRLEGSNPQTNSKILTSLATVFPSALLRLTSPALGASNREDSGTREVQVKYLYGGKDFDDLDYFAPVVIGIYTFLFVFLLTTVSFLRERSQGTIERLLASPLTRAEVVVGYMLGFGLFAILQSSVILLFALLVLGIHYEGNLGIVFIVVIILAMGAVNLGIFLSAFARNELQAVQFLPVVLVPQVLLSGIFWPIDEMPQYLQGLAYLMPLSYANTALRDVMIKGFSLSDSTVLLNLLALVAFAIAMVVFGTLALQKEVTS